MDKEIKQLENIFNLSKYEAKLYLTALNFDHVNVTDLSRKTKIPRTACYKPIEDLLNKGFLSAIKIRKRKFYRATDPKHLEYLLERKQVELKDMVANLEKQIDVPERKLAINYYSGREGIEMAADIILEEARSKRGKSWETTEVNIKKHGIRQLQDYIKRRVQKGIFGEMIVSSESDNKFLKDILSRDKKELRKSIVINSKKYPFKAAIMVMDDTVMIFTLGDDPFAVLIRNKDIATTMWSIHEMFWDRYN